MLSYFQTSWKITHLFAQVFVQYCSILCCISRQYWKIFNNLSIYDIIWQKWTLFCKNKKIISKELQVSEIIMWKYYIYLNLTIFDTIRQYLLILDIVWQYRTIFVNIGQYLLIYNNITTNLTIPSRLCCFDPRCLGGVWKVSGICLEGIWK